MSLQFVVFLAYLAGINQICVSQTAQLNQGGCQRWTKQKLYARCCQYRELYRTSCGLDRYNRDCRGYNCNTKSTGQDKKPSTTTRKPKADYDPIYKACCRGQGVPEECMGLCTYGVIDFMALCRREFHCENYLKIMGYCGANGKDNTKCCEKSSKQTHCSAYCNSFAEFPRLDVSFNTENNIDRQMRCLYVIKDINECNTKYHSGRKEWELLDWDDEKFLPVMETKLQKECLK